MPFQKGNQLAAKDRRWTAAINRALERRSKKEGQDELDRLADQFVELVATGGDLKAYQEFGNRIEGHPAQRTEITGEDGGPVYIKTGIDRLLSEAVERADR